MKCAFKNTKTAHSFNTPFEDIEKKQHEDQLSFVPKLTFNMLLKQRKIELLSKKDSLLSQHISNVNNNMFFLTYYYN